VAAIDRSARDDTKTVHDVPPELVRMLADLWHENPSDPLLVRLNARVGSDAALDRAQSLALDAAAPQATREAMFRIVGEFGRPDAIELLLALVGSREPAWVQTAAMEALAHFDDERVAAQFLAAYPSFDAPLRAKVRSLLFGRAEWTRRFLSRIDGGAVDPNEVDVEELRPIAPFMKTPS
jgi:hypothetical protein